MDNQRIMYRGRDASQDIEMSSSTIPEFVIGRIVRGSAMYIHVGRDLFHVRTIFITRHKRKTHLAILCHGGVLQSESPESAAFWRDVATDRDFALLIERARTEMAKIDPPTQAERDAEIERLQAETQALTSKVGGWQ